jgi:hypothetical protein
MIVLSDRSLSVGDRVEARHGGGPTYFPAEVQAANEGGTYALLYEDGDREPRVLRLRIRLAGEKQHANLEVGDVCDVRHGGGEQLYPGKVTKVVSPGVYNIGYDDGDCEVKVARKLIYGQCMTPCPATPAVECHVSGCTATTHNKDGYCHNHRMAATEAARRAQK